jgi:hypothetical protein
MGTCVELRQLSDRHKRGALKGERAYDMAATAMPKRRTNALSKTSILDSKRQPSCEMRHVGTGSKDGRQSGGTNL